MDDEVSYLVDEYGYWVANNNPLELEEAKQAILDYIKSNYTKKEE